MDLKLNFKLFFFPDLNSAQFLKQHTFLSASPKLRTFHGKHKYALSVYGSFIFEKSFSLCVFLAYVLPRRIYICIPHTCTSRRGQKRALDPMEPEIQVVVSYHVGASIPT